MNALRIGLAGLGTVGGGTWSVCEKNAEEIRRKSGKDIKIIAIAEPDKKKFDQLKSKNVDYYPDALSLINIPEMYEAFVALEYLLLAQVSYF